MRKTKENKGITLIALVITIIVLLILAGVSIATLTGNNGILTQTQKAKEEYNQATIKEKIQSEALGSIDQETGKFNEEKFRENLENNLGIDESKIAKDNDGNIIITTDGYKVTVNKNGKVEKTEKAGASADTPVDTPTDPVKPNKDYEKLTMAERFNNIADLKIKLFENMGDRYYTATNLSKNDGSVEKADCECGNARTIFDKAVEMGLVETYTESIAETEVIEIDEEGYKTSRTSITVPLEEPSMVNYEFLCYNDEQKYGEVIPMPYALNYEMTLNEKMWIDSGRANWNKGGGDFERTMAWMGNDWVSKGYTMISARATMYPNCSTKELEQVVHYKVQVLTQTNFKKAMKELGLDLSQYEGKCIHPVK